MRIELLNGKLKRRIYKTSGIILNAKHLLIIVHCCPVIPKSAGSVSMGSMGGATSGQLLPPEIRSTVEVHGRNKISPPYPVLRCHAENLVMDLRKCIGFRRFLKVRS
jgi:hypothetical protein